MSPDAPFDQYQRYRITGEIAGFCQQTAGVPPRVLDVGGNFRDLNGHPRLPIQEFLHDCFCVTIDLSFNPLQKYVRARGDVLPFPDGAFDMVACLDVLEHVPADKRSSLLREVSRASSRAIVVAAPFDDARVRQAEDLLAEFISRACGFVQEQLKEHRELGLPKLDDTRRQLEAVGWSLSVFPYGNLWRWLCMMIDKHAIVAIPGTHRTHHHIDNRFNREVFERDRETPCYRHFLIGAKDPSDPILSLAKSRFAEPRPLLSPEELLFDVARLHASNQEIIARGEPDRKEAHIAEIEAYRKAQIANLEELLKDVERSHTYRLRTMLRKVFPKSS